jgi:hypothetical protein
MIYVRSNDRRLSRSTLSPVFLHANAERIRSTRGQAVVEFAIVLPIILLIILGILDFGRAFNYQNDLTSMANQAVRYAEVNKCSACSGGQLIPDYIEATADSPELRNGNNGLGIQRQSSNGKGTVVTICVPRTFWEDMSPGGGQDGANVGNVGQPIEAVATAEYAWLPFFKFTDATLTATAVGRIEVATADPNAQPPAYPTPLVECPS